MNYDLKFETSIAKKLLTKQLNIIHGSLNSSIVLKSLTSKWAIFDTNLNGLKQIDKKVPLLNAPKFLKYYTDQIEMSDRVDLEEIDLDKQSQEYLAQYNNLGLCMDEIEKAVSEKIKSILPSGGIEVLFLEDSIKFVIGGHYIRTYIENGAVTVENKTTDGFQINGDNSMFYTGVVVMLLNSFDQKELLSTYHSYFSQKKHLKVLYREPRGEYDFNQIDFVEWLDMGSVGVYVLPLEEINGYKRELIVERETKKKHVIKIMCNNGDGVFLNEYETEFLKVAQDNGEIKDSIHTILKYRN